MFVAIGKPNCKPNCQNLIYFHSYTYWHTRHKVMRQRGGKEWSNKVMKQQGVGQGRQLVFEACNKVQWQRGAKVGNEQGNNKTKEWSKQQWNEWNNEAMTKGRGTKAVSETTKHMKEKKRGREGIEGRFFFKFLQN